MKNVLALQMFEAEDMVLCFESSYSGCPSSMSYVNYHQDVKQTV